MWVVPVRRGADAETRHELTEQTLDIWHGYLPGAARRASATASGSHGPWDPDAGPAVQPGQAAARPVRPGGRRRPSTWTPAVFGHVAGPTTASDATRCATTATPRRTSPQGVVVHDDFDWGDDRRPETPLGRHGDLRAARAGFTAAAPGRPAGAARHLRRAGAPGGDRAPDATSASPRSSCCRCTSSSPSRTCCSAGCATTGATTRSASSPRTRRTPPPATAASRSSEFKAMVQALHAAGIEVILDVVYNHTAEGGPRRADAVASAASTTAATTGSTPTTGALRRLHRLRQHPRRVTHAARRCS